MHPCFISHLFLDQLPFHAPPPPPHPLHPCLHPPHVLFTVLFVMVAVIVESWPRTPRPTQSMFGRSIPWLQDDLDSVTTLAMYCTKTFTTVLCPLVECSLCLPFPNNRHCTTTVSACGAPSLLMECAMFTHTLNASCTTSRIILTSVCVLTLNQHPFTHRSSPALLSLHLLYLSQQATCLRHSQNHQPQRLKLKQFLRWLKQLLRQLFQSFKKLNQLFQWTLKGSLSL